MCGFLCLLAQLNQRQTLFVAAYLKDGNATQAAKDAGYSERTAEQIGSRLLKNVQVAEAISAGQAKVMGRAEVTAERVLRELALIAFSDLRDVASWTESTLSLIPSEDLTEDAARALREVVSTVSETEHGTTRRLHVKQHDKLAALRMLGQYLVLFKDKLEVEHKGLGELFDEIGRRARETPEG